jgi:hypothetical protein
MPGARRLSLAGLTYGKANVHCRDALSTMQRIAAPLPPKRCQIDASFV